MDLAKLGDPMHQEPGRAIGREVAKGEAAEKELDAFISRRHETRRKTGPERELEASWKQSERRAAARRREENRAAWHGWHAHRAVLFARLSAEHAATAERLLEDDGRRTA